MTGDVSAADRLRWIYRTWTRWILVLVLLAVASVVGMSWTLGLFSASSANAGNIVTAGSMSQTNSAENVAIMRVSGLVPRSTAEGTATIENVGDARGEFVLRVRDVTDDPGPQGGVLSEHLQLTLYVGEGSDPLWSGPLADFEVDLGVWDPGESHTFRFVISMPESGAQVDNRFQRSRATATYEWHAIQEH